MSYNSKYTGAEVDAALDLAKTALQEHQDISGKQDTLISGTNIKTINGTSLLGRGNIDIEGGGEVYITPFTVEQFYTGAVNLTDEQRNELLNAASQNRIIGMPYRNGQTGYIVADFNYSTNEELDCWSLTLGVIYNGSHYSNSIGSSASIDFTPTRASITSFKTLIYEVTVEDGVQLVLSDPAVSDDCIYVVGGECTKLVIYLEPSRIGKIVKFYTGESCTLEFGYPVYWANGEVPIIEPYTHYELSLAANMDYAFNAVLTPFKSVE